MFLHNAVAAAGPALDPTTSGEQAFCDASGAASLVSGDLYPVHAARARPPEISGRCNDVSLRGQWRGLLRDYRAEWRGKSTLLKLITGILEPTSGDIITQGRIASLLELGAGFHPDLTGRENIFLNGSVYGLNRRQMRQRFDEIIDFAELGDFIDVPIKHYSSGMYVRLGFAVAIHTDPDLLLVDEVLAVGDATFQHKCLDSIQQVSRQGGTLLFVSHDLGTIQSLCNQAIWLDGGHVRAAGRPTDVAMAYLNDVAEPPRARLRGARCRRFKRADAGAPAKSRSGMWNCVMATVCRGTSSSTAARWKCGCAIKCLIVWQIRFSVWPSTTRTVRISVDQTRISAVFTSHREQGR